MITISLICRIKIFNQIYDFPGTPYTYLCITHMLRKHNYHNNINNNELKFENKFQRLYFLTKKIKNK